MTIIVEGSAVDQVEVVGGVDTHKDTHTVAAVDLTGRLLGVAMFAATSHGYRRLWEWLASHGVVVRVGVEGTGCYGAGLVRFLAGRDVDVVEVDRPDRRSRRARGKTDPFDAEAAARATLAETASGRPKVSDGQVEALRNLRLVRRSAVRQRADTIRRIKSLLVTAPEQLRAQLRRLPTRCLIQRCAGLRPDLEHIADPAQAVKASLRSLARRHQALNVEIDDLERLINPLVARINPGLLTIKGVGPEVAGQLLVTIGENPERMRSEGSFAMLCGVAPLPASSGKTRRHRLNRGGDRQANSALYTIVLARLQWDPKTKAYVQRRTQEGLSKKEIIRCLKRFAAREIYYHFNPTQTSQTPHHNAA